MAEHICNIFRYINCGILIVVSVQLRVAERKRSKTWTKKMRNIFRMVTLLTLLPLAATAEKLYQHAPFAWSVFAGTGIYLFCVYTVGLNELYEKQTGETK